jgi:pimeloyl-ACP methyl ester carboxylesterase
VNGNRAAAVVALVVLCSTAAACSSSSTKTSVFGASLSSPGVAVSATSATAVSASIVAAPVQTAHTSLGDVAYRTLGQGTPLVMIMGYGGSMETWDPRFVDTLAKHYRVVVFDNAGIGATKSLPTPLTIDAMADQTAALIASLGLTKPDVLGWSMGTMIGQALAIRHPADVAKLVLCASWPGNGTATVPPQTAIDELKSGVSDEVRNVLYPADQPYGYDAYVADLLTYPSAASASASTISAQDKAITDWWAGADPSGRNPASISAPTLIADGSMDALDNASNSPALAKLIPNATVQLYPDAGHAFLFQAGTPFTFEVEAFLSGSPAPAATATVSAEYAAGEAGVIAAGTTFDLAVKALPASPTSAQVAAIDEPYATTIADLDDELLHFGATGNVGAAVNTLVAANEQLITDLLALAVQSKPDVASWTTHATADGKAVHAANVTLRAALGLPAASQSS